MKKDNRTKTERVADHKRGWKKFLNSIERKKLGKLRSEDIKKKKMVEETKFQKHMARLRGELGAGQ